MSCRPPRSRVALNTLPSCRFKAGRAGTTAPNQGMKEFCLSLPRAKLCTDRTEPGGGVQTCGLGRNLSKSPPLVQESISILNGTDDPLLQPYSQGGYIERHRLDNRTQVLYGMAPRC